MSMRFAQSDLMDAYYADQEEEDIHYEEQIEKLMRINDCSREEAVEIYDFDRFGN